MWEIPIAMNEILYMDKGRVTIPKDCRDRRGLGDGDTLLFLETKSGALFLKPLKAKPKMSLIEHFKRFRGVELPQIQVHCPPRV